MFRSFFVAEFSLKCELIESAKIHQSIKTALNDFSFVIFKLNINLRILKIWHKQTNILI